PRRRRLRLRRRLRPRLRSDSTRARPWPYFLTRRSRIPRPPPPGTAPRPRSPPWRAPRAAAPARRRPPRASASGARSGALPRRRIAPRLAAARDRRDDRHLVAVLDRRVEVLQKADVLVLDEDVDEAPYRAGLVADALLDAGKALLQIGDQLADVLAARRHFFGALGQLAQRSRNANRGHGCLL